MNEEIESENVRIHSRADELIACLEGEIAKRDARIDELESRYQRDVYGLNNEGDPIGGEPAGGYANDNARLRAELAATKAQGVVMPEGWIPLTIEHEPGYPEDVAFGPKRMMDRLKKWLDRYFEMRLNAAPVQQVSVPDGWRDGYRAAMNSAATGARQLYVQHCHHHGVNGLLDRCKELEQSFIRDADALLTAAPAAPAADAWIPVSERLPDSGSTVIAYYLNSYGKGRTIRAQHVEDWTIEAEDVADVDTECVDYSEQDDCYYLLQGWYECIDNWDEYYRVAVTEGPITHWMPLPAAPIKIEVISHDQ